MDIYAFRGVVDVYQVQQLNSLQASGEASGEMDTAPIILDSSVNLSNIKMPKGFHKYLEETFIGEASGEMDTAPNILDSSVNLSNIKMPKGFHNNLEETFIVSTAKTLSEQTTLERSHSTFDSETPSSPSPRRALYTRRNKHMKANNCFSEQTTLERSHSTFDSETPSSPSPRRALYTRRNKHMKANNCFSEQSTLERSHSTFDSETASSPSPRRALYTRRNKETHESQQLFQVVLHNHWKQQTPKRQQSIQNEDNFENVLRQSSPTRSPTKSSFQFREIFQPSEIISSFVNRERRTQESTLPQNMLGASSPKETEYLTPFNDTNKESLENENQESLVDQSLGMALSSKTAQHITEQNNDTHYTIFETPKSMQIFGQRKMKSATDNSLHLKLERKPKGYRKLSQLNKFVGESSDSSNMSENAGIEKPIYVRKWKHSLNSGNAVISTKHIANTESRAIVHNMTSAVPSEVLADTKRKVLAHGLLGTHSNNYTGLHSKACKPGSEANTIPGLSKSSLNRTAHGQKKQRGVKHHDKQLKIPLLHRQGITENESHKLHLVLKSIAEGNVNQDIKLGEKYIVHPTSVDTKAKEETIKNKRKTNPALMVNGKVYRAPRLAHPKPWVNKRLYDYIMPYITAKYGKANSRIKAEEYVIYLCDQVSTVIRRKNYNNYRANLENIKKSLYRLGLIKCYNDYFVFIEKYLPFEFRYKAIPCLRAFGKRTGPPWSKDINIFADLSY